MTAIAITLTHKEMPVTRIPFPIPEPSRTALMNAGKLAMAKHANMKSKAYQMAHASVEANEAHIRMIYGVQEPDHA